MVVKTEVSNSRWHAAQLGQPPLSQHTTVRGHWTMYCQVPQQQTRGRVPQRYHHPAPVNQSNMAADMAVDTGSARLVNPTSLTT